MGPAYGVRRFRVRRSSPRLPSAASSATSIASDSTGAGWTTTFTDAVAGPSVPPLREVTSLVLLVWTPVRVPVPFTENVHDELAASVAPLRLTELEPADALIAPPPHDPVSPLGVATTRPGGSVSEKATPVSATVALGL